MSDRRYFVSVPNIVFDITLSENARRLYMRIKRDAGDAGALCNETLSKLARDAHMGKSQAIEARDELATPHPELDGLPLIRVRQRGRVGNATTHSIELVDLWPLNMARYAPKTLAAPVAGPVLNGTESQSHTEPAGPEWNREPVLNGTAYEKLNPEELNHCDAATAAVAAPSPMQTTQSAHAVDVSTLGGLPDPKPVPPHTALVVALLDELGEDNLNFARHVKDAKALAGAGFVPEDVRRIVRWLLRTKAEFFATEPLTMTTVRKYARLAPKAAGALPDGPLADGAPVRRTGRPVVLGER